MTASTLSPDPARTLADLVESQPARSRVFEDYDLDYCCGGDQTLAEACRARDLDVEDVLEALETLETDDAEPAEWNDPAELVDYIVEHHHDYLREELGPLGELIETVVDAHADAHPELHDLRETFAELKREIPVHLSEEEQLVFPAVRDWVASGEIDTNQRAILDQVLESLDDDHLETAEHLERIRDLTDDYTEPDDACPKYRAMLERLRELERDLHMHIHRENNVLFPEIEAQLT
jgi:regulator of cell morphogenesis and NO signaling